ncbi:23S rRNA (uracil(1939)-C(5))-methyltransferase RlmD [Aquimonas sp.]|jgi:23S rRNA (uracil1939-C5)-methyltransferase|uniref:23S rRNA (uracil(1939)-C(5))-methyltransferase RlmD n=1 Tax=Aquimonas sp. TaxID=1872588 RepID=UPI0037C04152
MARSNRPKLIDVEVDIVDLSHDGRGVARIDGKTVFISGALTGERVLAQLDVTKRKFNEGRTLKVLQASPLRVDPACAHYEICGGCALQHLDAAAQIEAKQRVLLENFERIGHVSPGEILPPLIDQPWGYRRKARLGVKWVKAKDRAIVGFREADKPQFIADISRCLVLVPQIGERISELSELITAMDARESIAQIEVAAGDEAVGLVFRHLQPLGEADRARLIEFAQRSGLLIFLQPGANDSVHPLWPADAELSFRIPAADVRLHFRPLDFVQVNAGMNQKMIARTLEMLDPQPQDRVLDLFCGLGNFTLPIARRAGSVVGVEGEAGLVARARDNAAQNGISNAEFYAADLAQDLRGEPWVKQGFDKLLLDPPRTGADAAIPQLPLKGVKRIVYVSCHPGSLARDAGILVRDYGYRLVSAGVMDMFPHTAHVESIALFER